MHVVLCCFCILQGCGVFCLKGPGRYEDAVVCCVRENPEPVIFKLGVDGFRPELELDKKQLHFDKVLIHRSVKRVHFDKVLIHRSVKRVHFG